MSTPFALAAASVYPLTVPPVTKALVDGLYVNVEVLRAPSVRVLLLAVFENSNSYVALVVVAVWVTFVSVNTAPLGTDVAIVYPLFLINFPVVPSKTAILLLVALAGPITTPSVLPWIINQLSRTVV